MQSKGLEAKTFKPKLSIDGPGLAIVGQEHVPVLSLNGPFIIMTATTLSSVSLNLFPHSFPRLPDIKSCVNVLAIE